MLLQVESIVPTNCTYITLLIVKTLHIFLSVTKYVGRYLLIPYQEIFCEAKSYDETIRF